MTLEERVKKALQNVEKGLASLEPDKKLNLTGKQYLENQRLLLKNLLERDTW